MKFPALGDYVPQSFGQNVWDPYVMYMVEQRARAGLPPQPAQIYDGGYVISTIIDDTKMAALYQAVSQNEAQIDDSCVPFDVLHARGRGAGEPGDRRDRGPVPRAGLPRREVQRDRAGHHGQGVPRDHLRCEHGLSTREQVGSSFKPYVLSAAVKEGMNVQTSTLNGYNILCIPPDTEPDAYPRPRAQDCRRSRIVGRQRRRGRERSVHAADGHGRVDQHRLRRSLAYGVAGQGSDTTINNVGEMAQLFGVDTGRGRHHRPGRLPGRVRRRARPGLADRHRAGARCWPPSTTTASTTTRT